jgi:hypothetical protein
LEAYGPVFIGTVIMNGGAVVRPSQLIASVLRTKGKRVRNLAVLTMLGALTSSCAGLPPLSNAYARVDAAPDDRCAFGARHENGSCDVYEVSLAELLVMPERFQQKQVRVGGYVRLAFEGNTVCERRETGASCLWLDVEGMKDPGFRKGWAVVEGVFNGENRGHMGGCSGAIERITGLTKTRR